MIDFIFMEFYIMKKYNLRVEQYFNIGKQSVSGWRTYNKIPSSRMIEFLNKEKTLDVKILIDKIY